MKPQLIPGTYNVSAYCSTCEAVTSFELKHSVITHQSQKIELNGRTYSRALACLCQCASCRRGGMAEILDHGETAFAAYAALASFSPPAVDQATLPKGVPEEIFAEFREAEKCAAYGLNRAASALFRSALEKTLKINGYTKNNDSGLKDLQKRIDAAADDGIITAARQKKAHENIRALGNDVLHDAWRRISDQETEESRKYTQRVIEDFYDDRPTVERILTDAGKMEARELDSPNAQAQ